MDADSRRHDGPAGNERLTAWTGATLLVLLAVEGVTIVALGTLVVPHIVIGMLLVGPVALKLASTTYRFTRYYRHDPDYRRAGPPAPLLRVLGPVVVLTSVAVLATGVALLYVPAASRPDVFVLHKLSFIVWFVAMTIHVLAYVGRLPRLLAGDMAPRVRAVRGRGRRLGALAASLVVGAVIAAVTYHLATPWSHGTFLHG